MTTPTRPLLLIMNPRRMRECLDSFAALTVPRAYMTGFTERELCSVIPEIIASTDYTHYVIVSDDTVVPQRAVDAVYAHLDGHPVVTGWCNLDEQSALCSVVDKPLVGDAPTADSYSFMHWTRVVMHPDDLIRTWFSGMCLTGMAREMWQRYPFSVFQGGNGYASDYRLCWRLQQDEVPIMAVREGVVTHVRERWDVPDPDPRKRLYLGNGSVEIVP